MDDGLGARLRRYLEAEISLAAMMGEEISWPSWRLEQAPDQGYVIKTDQREEHKREVIASTSFRRVADHISKHDPSLAERDAEEKLNILNVYEMERDDLARGEGKATEHSVAQLRGVIEMIADIYGIR